MIRPPRVACGYLNPSAAGSQRGAISIHLRQHGVKCFCVDQACGIAYNTIMEPFKVVIDTNVLVSALRSRSGASFRVLELLGSERFEIQVSVPLVLEYESAARRVAPSVGLSAQDVADIIDYVCRVANRRKIFFLWRPLLKDPKDDHVLELAVEAQCDFIVTYNTRDFKGADQFGLRVITGREFLEILGELS